MMISLSVHIVYLLSFLNLTLIWVYNTQDINFILFHWKKINSVSHSGDFLAYAAKTDGFSSCTPSTYAMLYGSYISVKLEREKKIPDGLLFGFETLVT